MRRVFLVVALSLFAPNARARPELDIGLGFGGGHIGHADDEAGSQTMFVGFEFGQRVGERTYMIGRLDSWMLGRYSPDPALTQDHNSVTLGIRWHPFPPPGEELLAVSALQLKLAAGFGSMSRHSLGSIWTGDRQDLASPSGVIHASIAWMPYRGRDYALGLEIGDHLALSGSGVRNMFVLAMTVQLAERRP